MNKGERETAYCVVLAVIVIVLFITAFFTLRPEEPYKGEFIETIVLVMGEEHQVARTGYSLILLEAESSASIWHYMASGTIEVYYDSEYIAREMFVEELQVENLMIVLDRVGNKSAEVSLYLK